LKNDMLISVIVTTYNRPDALSQVICALLDQTDVNFEVIIADDGSSESTRKLIASFQELLPSRSPARLVHTWQPDQGFRASAVRNMGVFASRGEYLIFLDGDCVPRADFVARHRSIAEPGYLVSGSRVLLSEKLTRQLLSAEPAVPVHAKGMAYWFLQRLTGNVNKVLPLIHLPDNRLRRYRSIRWNRIKSCNLAVWNQDFVKVNGFDESFVGWGHEDADLVLRLARLGVRRKGGAFCTEVFHLWHQENTRVAESDNRSRVEERMRSALIEATTGLRNHPQPDARFE
jgi:glycosyltransferase involved in cell wall biosynthesis